MRTFLQREGISLSKAIVHKCMNHELQLLSIYRRKRPVYHRGLAHKIFPNLLKRNFSSKQPNRVWCTDFTYMTPTNETTSYNCSIIDLYDRSSLPVKIALLHNFPGCAYAWKSVDVFQVYPTKLNSILGARKSVYVRWVCTIFPESRDFSKYV